MKRFMLLLACCVLFGGGVSNAEISRGTDNFTGGDFIISGVDSNLSSNGKVSNISFCKTISAEKVIYEIFVKSKGLDRFTVSREDLQMNIDGRETYKIISTNRMDSVIGGDHVVALDYTVENNVIEKIKDSGRVALKFTQNNGSQFVYVLPDDVLAEWKQVIATEK